MVSRQAKTFFFVFFVCCLFVLFLPFPRFLGRKPHSQWMRHGAESHERAHPRLEGEEGKSLTISFASIQNIAQLVFLARKNIGHDVIVASQNMSFGFHGDANYVDQFFPTQLPASEIFF